jgi:hypothetical protein
VVKSSARNRSLNNEARRGGPVNGENQHSNIYKEKMKLMDDYSAIQKELRLKESELLKQKMIYDQKIELL